MGRLPGASYAFYCTGRNKAADQRSLGQQEPIIAGMLDQPPAVKAEVPMRSFAINGTVARDEYVTSISVPLAS